MARPYKHDDEGEQHLLDYPSLQRGCVSRQEMIAWGGAYRVPVGGFASEATARLLNNLTRKRKLVESSPGCYALPDR